MPLVITEGPGRKRYLPMTVGHDVNVVTDIDVTTMHLDIPWLHYHWVATKGFKTWGDEMVNMPLLENSNQVFYPQWSVIIYHSSVGLAARKALSVTNTLWSTAMRFHSPVI